MSDSAFLQFLRSGSETGFQTDDVLAAALPLFRQVATWHEETLVAPLSGLGTIVVDEPGALRCEGTPTEPVANLSQIEQIQRPVASALRVIGHARVTSDEDTGTEYTNLEISDGESELKHPAYIIGYRTWEEVTGHHDASTDILALGQILASLALGLDFSDADDVGIFVAHRANLFGINGRLHPVLAAVIGEMTELNRHRRAPDLPSLIRRLEQYREQTPDVDVAKLPGFAEAGLSGRRKMVQAHLRDRLFEITRRNRLLYFKPSQASLNFTVASVPMVMNLASVRLDQLFVWHPALAAEVTEGKAMNLGRWLRFEDQPYLPSALDKLISDARRDRAEYGFAQLRLVVAFLHWHNLKDAPQERIVSPLLLLPVELSKKKGVRDQYLLEPGTSEAEVNPALRHHLSQLYGLRLPETVDLRTTPLEQFHRDLEAQIRASEPGVSLRLVDKPEIQLIHQRARQRLAQFQRKQKLRAPARRTKASFDYSYDRENFRPLGLQLFREKVLPTPLPQRSAAGGVPEPRLPHMVAPATPAEPMVETERQTYALREDRPGNPYAWDFDLCSLTVGNFNYRKMSLVRDYGALLDDELASEAFDRVFSLDPRPVDDEPLAPLARADQWPVVQGDATQAAAVALARTGRSYIIQGPPGTGKSQTITNLIADYVARGKRVLFVCEKRAAIDVVFHRLRQQGLDELCCLIHDSQTDKKAFIQNLRQTYEKWLAEPDGADEARAARAAAVRQMEHDVESLQRFDAVMRSAPEHVATPIRELLHRLVELREHEPPLTASEAEHLPAFALWRTHAETARRLAATLAEVANANSLGAHPFRWLGDGVIRAERPLEALGTLTDRAETLLDEVESALGGSGLPEEHWDTMEEIAALVAFASQVSELAARGQLALLAPGSLLTQTLEETVRTLVKHDQAVQRAQAQTVNWREKLPVTDVPRALARAKANENSFLRFLKPAWWQLKKVIETRYDFSRHAIRPPFSQVLTELAAEYAALAERAEVGHAAMTKFGVDPQTLLHTIAPLQAPDFGQPALLALRSLLLESSAGAGVVERLHALAPRLAELVGVLETLLADFRRYDLAKLGEAVRELREEADALPELLPLLGELAETPPQFAHALRTFAFTPDQMEAAVAHASLEEVYRRERWLPRFDGRVVAHRAARIGQMERAWLGENAAAIRAEVRRRFREHVQISSQPATQLNSEEKVFKKGYSAGRRDLEHEFGKTMRYKSIRDLAAGETGQVVRDLKPIWLMSPLSVSDTLPLAPDLFDVVIFDEASQIPVEEAVPALYRAPQVIVVGDEMQLPPTNFFSAGRDAGDETLEIEEDGERVAVSLDADSFLTQSAKNLSATLLAWHYRSRSESLISFSNAAFYAGNLYTIPDRTLPAPEQEDIVVQSAADGAKHCDALLGRPLSFHFMKRSPYEGRRNIGEATYIAQLLRELLLRNIKLSIGIVAFSEAQQGAIESALETLAEEDAAFAGRLEEEYAREEDDQFCGLFVKNLENVQGDERDIILLSICYGPDASGRMVMNFGPINQRGGEKRLNVIFTRARHYMAVISSIRHHAITNDYNDGAAALKNFLDYVECASSGELRLARGVLESLNPLTRKQLGATHTRDAVIQQLATALRSGGYTVDEHVGQSRFRCDLAVRGSDARQYCLGIIVDTATHYANPSVAERCVTQPGILRAFGWEVALVLTRDWYHEPQAVLDRLVRVMRGEAEPPLELEDDLPYPARTPAPVAPIPGPAAPPTTFPPAARPAPGGAFQRFELVEGRSSKFWEIAQDGVHVHVRYGRIGTQGQTQTKSFETPVRAAREVEKLTAEKTRKGYRET
jgi:predicted DNA-binding WGR domain protein